MKGEEGMIWVVYQRRGYGGLPLFERAYVSKRTPKQLQLSETTGYSSRIAPEQVVAEFDNEAAARNLHDALLAIRGEYERRVSEARESATAKINDEVRMSKAEQERSV
jgi:hypothetical protein